MNAIELTEDHRTKLLEMCKALFPEHEWGFGSFYTSEVGAEYEGLDYLDVTHINHKIPNIVPGYELIPPKKGDDGYESFQNGFVSNIKNGRNFFSRNGTKIVSANGYSETYVEGIHWFEFCCKHLAKRIYNDNIGKTKSTYSSFVGECVIVYFQHPIDYLYSEFKKLSK